MKRTVSYPFLLATLFAGMTFQGRAQKGPLQIGDDAPAFKVATWLKGNPGSGIERGKVNIVEFWATWCAPCLANVPHLSKLTAEYAPKGVKVFGISVSERKTVDADSLRRFIAGPKGQGMHYIVGADDSAKYMATNWYQATGQRGIPFAMVVDRNGKIAWMGHPAVIEKALEKIVDGHWDLREQRKLFAEDRRLDSIDGSIIPQFNTYTNPKNNAAGLVALDSLLQKEPALKYRHYTAHYTFVFLINTNPEKAVAFARETWAANDFPDWKGVSDMMHYLQSKNAVLPPSAYVLGADALQAQLDHYPWAMNAPDTYNEIASFQFLAGDRAKAVASEEKAIESAKKDEKFSAEQLAKYQESLNRYKAG